MRDEACHGRSPRYGRTEVERNKADIIKVIISVAGIGAALMAVGFAFLRLTGTG